MIDRSQHEILLIEDNRGDATLAREAFLEAGVPARLSIVDDGARALHYLRGEGEYAGRPRPDIVLLDLKLPGKDGLEVLREVKGDPELWRTPIVVLTTSTAERDVLAAYARHANSYLRKPVSFEEFVALARSIGDYWLGVVRLPPA